MSGSDPIGAVEDAIVDRLRGAFTSGGKSALKRIEPLERPFDSRTPGELGIHAPAVYVVPYVGKPTGNERHLRMLWWLYCIADGATPATRARGGAGAFGIGTYAVASRVVAALDGWLPEVPEASTLEVAGIENMTGLTLERERKAVLAVTVTGIIECTGTPDGSGLEDFRTYHSDWDIPPRAEAPDALPVSDPDATNTVTLEGASG